MLILENFLIWALLFRPSRIARFEYKSRQSQDRWVWSLYRGVRIGFSERSHPFWHRLAVFSSDRGMPVLYGRWMLLLLKVNWISLPKLWWKYGKLMQIDNRPTLRFGSLSFLSFVHLLVKARAIPLRSASEGLIKYVPWILSVLINW